MKLTELNPRWFTLHGWASDSLFIIGLSFECPHCKTQRLAIGFDPPIDPDKLAGTMFPWSPDMIGHKEVWKRTGDTFDTLTLTPSIDASQILGGHWHGHITNGEIK